MLAFYRQKFPTFEMSRGIKNSGYDEINNVFSFSLKISGGNTVWQIKFQKLL